MCVCVGGGGGGEGGNGYNVFMYVAMLLTCLLGFVSVYT